MLPILKERIATLKDAYSLTQFLFEDVAYEKELLLQRKATPELAKEMLEKTKALLTSIDDWSFETIQNKLTELIQSNNWNVGQFFMVLRVAICGSQFTLPVVETLPILGKEKTIHKLEIAISKLS